MTARFIPDHAELKRVVDGLPAKIDCLAERLRTLADLAGVGEIRQYGLAAGIELVADRETKEPFPPAERRGMRVCRRAREKGVFLRPLGDVIVAMPPLSITREEIGMIVRAIDHGIRVECAEAR